MCNLHTTPRCLLVHQLHQLHQLRSSLNMTFTSASRACVVFLRIRRSLHCPFPAASSMRRTEQKPPFPDERVAHRPPQTNVHTVPDERPKPIGLHGFHTGVVFRWQPARRDLQERGGEQRRASFETERSARKVFTFMKVKVLHPPVFWYFGTRGR